LPWLNFLSLTWTNLSLTWTNLSLPWLNLHLEESTGKSKFTGAVGEPGGWVFVVVWSVRCVQAEVIGDVKW